jgi:hypothetical protein
MQSSKTKPKQISLREALKASKGPLVTRMGSTERLLRLAKVWTDEVVRYYPEEAGEFDDMMSAYDWVGLVVIESKFAKLSREHSIRVDEHERGVAEFLKFALMLYTFDHGFSDVPPSINYIAGNFGFCLRTWLDPVHFDSRVKAAGVSNFSPSIVPDLDQNE